VGGPTAHLIVDDTAIPKKGTHSVGVSHQYCGQLGKTTNCQSLVSLTLATDEIPVPIALRLYLPESWINDEAKREKTGVPESAHFRTKWKIALEEIQRIRNSEVQFGDVLADAGYGEVREFRAGLSALGLRWAVGVSCQYLVYPTDVVIRSPETCVSTTGRPRTLKSVDQKPMRIDKVFESIEDDSFEEITWRQGTKKPLSARFFALRARPADGERSSSHSRLPADECWLVCEWRSAGEKKYYMTNHSSDTPLETLAAVIKARWSCELAHQQMKEELGLGHFEGRTWHGLHHHAVLTMISFAFLQHLRILENKS
jgi:SRSO17 transposase